MFYIFIFESIGTSELVLIGLVALIVFGPRKLPGFARTIGKTMAEFRRSTDDFKKTWQQELDLEEAKKSFKELTDFQNVNEIKNENSTNLISSTKIPVTGEFGAPEIKEFNAKDFNENLKSEIVSPVNKTEVLKNTSEKQNWL